VPFTTLRFDCAVEVDNWQIAWSATKKAWCCTQENKACPGQPFHPPSISKVFSTSPCPPMDCNVAFNNWQASWSPVKKRYCCKKVGRGCPPGQQPLNRPALHEARPKPVIATAAPQPQTPAATAALQLNSVASTAAPQQPPMPVGRARVPQPQPQAAPAPTGIRPAWFSPMVSMVPQDCNIGFANWQAAWSLMKKRWCCSYQGKACMPGMVPFEAFLSVKSEVIEERSPTTVASNRQAAVWTSFPMLLMVGVCGCALIGCVLLRSFNIGRNSFLYQGLQEAPS